MDKNTDQRPQVNSARDAWEHLEAVGGIVTAIDIAQRLNVSRARVGQLTVREDWPEPVTHVGRSPVWLWADVCAWRAVERKPGPKPRS